MQQAIVEAKCFRHMPSQAFESAMCLPLVLRHILTCGTRVRHTSCIPDRDE